MPRAVFRPILSLCLCIAIAVTGASSAAARLGMKHGGTGAIEIVLCSEGEARTVLLDARGNPVDTKDRRDCMTCPDCNLVKSAMPPVAPSIDATRTGSAPRALKPARTAAALRSLFPTRSRGPPSGEARA